MKIETHTAVAVGIAAAATYYCALNGVCNLMVTNHLGPRTYEPQTYDKWFSINKDICVLNEVPNCISLGITAAVAGVLTKWCTRS